MILAGSVNASAEKLAAAELKLRKIRLHPPKGKGELFDAAEKRFSLSNIYDEVAGRNLVTHAECQKQTTMANQQYSKLPWKIQEIYDPIIDEANEQLDLLRIEAESAKRSELEGDAHRLPDEKRWPAAKERFDEAVAKTVSLDD